MKKRLLRSAIIALIIDIGLGSFNYIWAIAYHTLPLSIKLNGEKLVNIQLLLVYLYL